MNFFLYTLAAVIAFYASAFIVLVDSFLRYKRPRSMKIVTKRLETVSLLVYLDVAAYMIGIVFLIRSDLQSTSLSISNIYLYVIIYLVIWIPIFILSAKLKYSSR
ncbi:MAG: hypothetical protein M1327_04870 [Candidatus Thermoplasmatota archaeon]|nr:hypothetical protein [Candidatus Thermoplasmatota archaeon]